MSFVECRKALSRDVVIARADLVTLRSLKAEMAFAEARSSLCNGLWQKHSSLLVSPICDAALAE